MRNFIQRALHKIPKLDEEQIKSLICMIAKDNEQMEAVLESLTDGILVGDTKNQVILANKSLERLVPTQKDSEIVLWEKIKDPDISSAIKKSIEQAEPLRDKEFTLLESERILAVSVMPLVMGGELRGNLVYVKDITEQRRKEARLRRAENLASLTNLTAGVAHEIKNPLGSISIHIQLMERILGSKDNEEIRKYLTIISEEVNRLNHIVVDFLFAVRPIDIQLELSDVNIFMHDTINFLKYELEEANITLNEHYQIDIPHVLLDDKFMKQAVMNIVKNAINAMPNGGRLGIETKVYGDSVKLSISDTGTGMSDEVLKKIFEPYYTTKDFGSGIGLTIVYKIIKEHRGDICVHSTEGRGTTFSITLPVPSDQRNLLASQSSEQSEPELTMVEV